MLTALDANSPLMLLSGMLLISTAAVWISLAGRGVRVATLCLLFVIQVSVFAVAASATAPGIDADVLLAAAFVLACEWALILPFGVSRLGLSSDEAEPTT
jgi:hypothetical protein